MAAGRGSDETDIIISLFRAYETSSNDEFKMSVNFWKNEWYSGRWNTAEQLMEKADSKYTELKQLGTWGKRAGRDEQIVALNAKITKMTDKKKEAGSSKDDEKKSNVPKWKYDRSLSSNNTLEKNGKTYWWCPGPGHNGKPMWARHRPGTCTNDASHSKQNKSGSKGGFSTKALTAQLKEKGLSEEEVESKLEAILAVMES